MPTLPVLLIHGVGSSFEHNWQATGWVDLLESEGREVVPVHLPGHGPNREFRPGDTASRRVIAAAVERGQLDAVGFSAGGHALLSAACECPDLFGRIALLGVGDPASNAAPGAGAEIADGLEADEEPSDAVPRIIRRLVDSAGNDRFAVASFLRSPSAPLRLEDIRRVSVPTLVVLGDQDFAGPADRLVDALAQGELVTLPGVDHFATPSNFGCIDAVLRFLDG